MNWTRSSNGDYTLIERSLGSVWDRGAGTEIYNDTSSDYTDSGLTISTVYYYQAWAFNESTSNFSTSKITNNHTGPVNPSNVATSISGTTLNFTWTKGTRADNTVIIRKTDGFPSGVTDGTEIYNGSATGYDDTSFTTTSFYRLFSYNTTNNLFSIGVNAEWGALSIRVFDGNTSNPLTGWGILISNSAKTDTYENTSASNPLLIDIRDLPFGTNTMMVVNASYYDTSIFYMDLSPNNYYALDAYLPLSNDTESYVIRIVDQIQNPVESAKVYFKKYINSTVGYQNVSIRLTNANGYCTVNLVPNTVYSVDITKEGYISSYGNDLPVIPIVWGDERYHTLPINSIINDYEIIMDNLTFDIQPEIRDHTEPIVFYFNMTSSNSLLEWFRMTTYQYNYSTETWDELYTETDTTSDGGSISFTTNHTVGLYGLRCEFKKTDWNQISFAGEYEGLFFYTIYNVSDDTIIDDIDTIDDIIDEAMGKSPVYWQDQAIAWSSLGAAIAVMLTMFTFTPKLAGFAVMSVGAVLGFFKAPLGLISEDVISMTAVVIIFILGVLVLIVEGKKQ